MTNYYTTKDKTKVLTSTYLPSEIKTKLRKKCKESGTNISTVLRQLVIEYLNK